MTARPGSEGPSGAEGVAGPSVGPVPAGLHGELLCEGAEARVYLSRWLGRPALFKQRVVKGYRHPELDARLRTRRTRVEARLLVAAAEAGIRVPRLYQVRPSAGLLVMEYLEAPCWKELLARDHRTTGPSGSCEFDNVRLARRAGRLVARVHELGLVHGDLTTSNLLVRRGRPVLIDWGLGGFEASLEKQGLDLQVLWECATASHPEQAETLLAGFNQGYLGGWEGASQVLERQATIRERGRYR